MAVGDVYEWTMNCLTYNVAWSSRLYLVEEAETTSTDPVGVLNAAVWAQLGVNIRDVLSQSTEFCNTEMRQVKENGLPPSLVLLDGAFGAVAGKALPPNKCINVRLLQDTNTGRSHGTMRLSGLPDADSNGNVYLPGNHTATWTAINTVLTTGFFPGGGINGAWRFSVRSTSPNSPTGGDPPFYAPIIAAEPSTNVHNMRPRTSRHLSIVDQNP